MFKFSQAVTAWNASRIVSDDSGFGSPETEAAEVHRHLGAEYSLDVAAVARSAPGTRSTTYSAPIVDQERG